MRCCTGVVKSAGLGGKLAAARASPTNSDSAAREA